MPRPIARRGSTSAPDPFNVHAQVNLDPNRSCTSTITIVKASDEPLLAHRKSLQRKFSPSSPNRLSFAFSSFSNHRPSSPTLPSSPSSASTHFSTGKPRLSPDQIVDLARQAGNPAHTSATHVFTPLPDDVYLPFLDRPAEVAALISSPPDSKLFALLAHTFSLRDRQVPIQSDGLPRDPTAWSYIHLIYHLTKIDRDVAPDFLWSIAARKCILSHSELIWERVKGALGIPPELDVDYEFLEDDQASPEGSEDGDLQGERDDKWEEAVLDSPVTMKPPGLLPVRTGHDDYKTPISRDFAYSDSPSPDHDQTQVQISIEPLVASEVSNSNSSLPAGSLAEGLGLSDIAEGAEEEEEERENLADQEGATKSSTDPTNSILPSQIQGLRISTTPLAPTTMAATPPLTATSTSVPGSAPPTAHSRTSSVSSLVGPFNRCESTGALASLWSVSAQAGVFFSGSDAGDSYDGKEGDKDKMQGMGPMFPGNFARLGSGLRRSSSSSTSSARGKVTRVPHARYIASDIGIEQVMGGDATPTSPKEKVRAFSHAGGQRPFVQLAPRRRSWGAAAGAR